MDRRLLLVLAVLAPAGCNRPGHASREVVSRSLDGVMVYPRSQPVSLSAGDSAGQLSLWNADAPDSVADWYRGTLVRSHWTLKSDHRQPDGTILIYAERRQQPLWISIQKAAGARGSNYSLTGAVVGSADSAATDSTQRSGSSMSSKRIQRR